MPDVGDGRRRRVAADDQHRFDVPDFAIDDALADAAKRGVVPAIESDREQDARALGGGDAGAGAADVEVDRLFAEDRLARGSAGLDQAGMRVSRARDQQGIDAVVRERGSRVGNRGSACLCNPARGRGVDVHHVLEAGSAMRGDIRGVDPADAAGAEERKRLHDGVPPDSRSVNWKA